MPTTGGTGDTSVEWARREAEKCMYCGFCEAVCPTLPFGPHRGYGPRGRVYIAKLVLEERRVTEEALASIYSCLTCRACTLKCVVGIEVAELMKVLRSLYRGGFFGKPVEEITIRARE